MAERHKIWCGGDLRLPQCIGKPRHLRFAVFGGTEQVGENRVCVLLVLRSVKSYHGDVAHTHGEIAPQIPVARRSLLWLAVHPHPLKVPVGQPARIMVAGNEQVRHCGGIVLERHIGLEERAFLFLHGLGSIAGVAVPHHTRRRNRPYHRRQFRHCVPVGVRVVDDTEVALRPGSCRAEGVNARKFLVAGNLHVVCIGVIDAVSPHLIIICGGG